MLENEKENIQKIYSFCKNYYLNNKKFPVINEIMSHTKLERRKVVSILKLLIQHKYIKFNKNRYYLSEQKLKRRKKKIKDAVITVPVQQKEEESTKQEAVKPETKQTIKINKIIVFKVLISIILIAFVYIGIEYNYIAFRLTKSFFNALISAIGFFVFGIISFECFILFIIRKNYLLSSLFFFLFLIIFLNNFLNIMSGQFEKYQECLFSQEKIELNNNKELYNLYEKQEKELETELNNRLSERRTLQEQIKNDFDNKNLKWQEWTVTNKKIPEIENKLKDVRDKKEKLLSSNQITKETKITIYDFLSKILKTPPNIIQFIHLVFPSFILDIISSISLALVFFLKNE